MMLVESESYIGDMSRVTYILSELCTYRLSPKIEIEYLIRGDIFQTDKYTFPDAWESEELYETEVISGDDGVTVKGGVCCIDVIDLGILWPDPIDL